MRLIFQQGTYFTNQGVKLVQKASKWLYIYISGSGQSMQMTMYKNPEVFALEFPSESLHHSGVVRGYCDEAFPIQ